MKLKDKVAVITGGAMGIGKGIVSVFLKEGAIVNILDYSDKLEETIQEFINKGYVGKIFGHEIDVRKKDLIDKARDNILEKFGRVDILVNVAGVARVTKFEETPDDVRDFHFDINIKGVWNVTQSFIHNMIKNEKGAIVNLSSVTGSLVADPGMVAYATSKAAVKGFTKGIAAEYASKNIRCNAILPGYIKTPMVDGIANDSNPNDPNSVFDGIASGVPLGRLGDPEEVGDLAAFLASDEASYLTGADFVIDGGSTLPETVSVGI